MRTIIIFSLICLMFPPGPAAKAYGQSQPIRMNYSFFSRWYTSDGMPRESMSYLRISRTDARPLYVTGWGRRGRLEVLLENIVGVGDTYMISTKGHGVVVYSHYPPGGKINPNPDYPVAQWINNNSNIRFHIDSLRSWRQLDDDLDRFLRIREIRSGSFVSGRRRIDVPSPRFEVLMDCVVSVDGKSVVLKGQKAQVQFDLGIGGSRQNPYPIWKMTVSADLKVNGSELGLKGADSGPLEMHVVFGAPCRQPSISRREDLRKSVEQELEDSMDIPDLLNLF